MKYFQIKNHQLNNFHLDTLATGKRNRRDAELDSGPIMTSRRTLESADGSVQAEPSFEHPATNGFHSKPNNTQVAPGNSLKLAATLKNCRVMNNLDL